MQTHTSQHSEAISGVAVHVHVSSCDGTHTVLMAVALSQCIYTASFCTPMLSHLLDSFLPLAVSAWPEVTRARAAPLDIEEQQDKYLLLVDLPGVQAATLLPLQCYTLYCGARCLSVPHPALYLHSAGHSTQLCACA